ncbi:aminomethyl-transferring glycine dehydrogenase subunit GcvPA [Candidatus Igneacidithiobacillus taiwanensis]|uniref:aminomethyl-transferring glycine dehydrogenase subunit GcvPA n=1 Tax=Candidatus Igneacidithiobacillus taiwanensis TaxID=1945924 RepID=UPI0028A0D6AC|nr:aminomethyl-transferring glycine dehydrogenase subunit GcvPA [Candidatus Igneacidithiobacillus taiwanensis]MCE5359524.1 aminomethyl-transferring glycine dehydrogenase subunit GcvPA [Acidithiobacillus sp.]
MSYIPHDAAETAAMLAAIGVQELDELFDEIPAALQSLRLDLPEACSEARLRRLLEERAAVQAPLRCFAGAGAYSHHIPAIVWEVARRGEFYSAYTPYQAEASQGTLQLLYEFQSFMTRLTAMEISNASLYDGATALVEACLMALRLRPQAREILIPAGLWPHWQRVLDSLLSLQGIRLRHLPQDAQSGRLQLPAAEFPEAAALVIPQSNRFGLLEDVDAAARWAEARQLLRIAVVNPLALALLKPPGEWGAEGVDIAVGEGQPLGVPLAGGGPYFGFLTCKRAYVRQLPGRLVAKTVDAGGKTAYCLTLQAREQHIRRAGATSNICTNQGLLVTAATVHLAALGAAGLRSAAARSHQQARKLQLALTALPGVSSPYAGQIFNEFLLRLPQPAAAVRDRLLADSILAGVPAQELDPSANPHDLLVAATELSEDEDLDAYTHALARALEAA